MHTYIHTYIHACICLFEINNVIRKNDHQFMIKMIMINIIECVYTFVYSPKKTFMLLIEKV